jgi:mannose/fructose/N-acetylgalactosamine-specific phosphotransferase system component IID
MYIVPIAWLYVTVMMAVAEATNTTGTVLGGVITFLLYGLLPVSIVVYVMGSPARKRAIKAKERAELADVQAALGFSPDAGAETTTDAVAPVRKEL